MSSDRARAWGAKASLFRKVNTTAHGVHHGTGGDFHEQRNGKAAALSDAPRLPMHGKARRGLDYTPLFRFLQSVARLDRPEPIFWLVARQPNEEQDVVRVGESSYFSGLRIDGQGRLQRVNPSVGPGDLMPLCGCCTHTLNGIKFTRVFNAAQ